MARRAPKTNTMDALLSKDAWVDWEVFQARGHAYLEDVDAAFKTRLRPYPELAGMANDAALLALSGLLTPHLRVGQLETVVITPNTSSIKCIHPLVGTRWATQCAPTCTHLAAPPSAFWNPGGALRGAQGARALSAT